MASAEFENRDDAAEYALGTLDCGGDARHSRRAWRTNPALAAQVAQWQQRLVALDEETQVAEPPPHMLAGIMDRIGAPAGDNVVVLKRRADLWRPRGHRRVRRRGRSPHLRDGAYRVAGAAKRSLTSRCCKEAGTAPAFRRGCGT